ncbi:MAG: hypothetical protein COT21_03075 [Hadesarchaea archaeon CG08_land_8_20_14_0_20_51_8]|jgi:hypothetical protein|nr:MAG: hypothetical protein COT21_03075 [Hadesarchaea archaeon CG08_land_8_20_14_0_20_51_8]
MVTVAKIFEFREQLELDVIARKLKDFSEEEPHEREGKRAKLTAEILDLKLEGDSLSGVFSKDFVLGRYYKRGLVEILVTEEVPFWVKRSKGRTFLIVLAPSKARGVKKLLTNYVANKLSEILFIKTGAIVETKITHETLKELHESNPRATKLIWFDEVDIPDIKKIALAGSALADTKLYRDYVEHGRLWYIVFEVMKRGLVVGITRNSVVTLFSKTSVDEFINFVLEEIIPITE